MLSPYYQSYTIRRQTVRDMASYRLSLTTLPILTATSYRSSFTKIVKTDGYDVTVFFVTHQTVKADDNDVTVLFVTHQTVKADGEHHEEEAK